LFEEDGTMFGWGFEFKGRLGNNIEDNDFHHSLAPKVIPNIEHLHIFSASCGGAHTLIIAKDNRSLNTSGGSSVSNVPTFITNTSTTTYMQTIQ
jgi:alpha-tubulin suppressor-like RCC1 family protein